jgi:hypothetical protein
MNLIGLEALCTLREQSRLPICLGGGSRTSKDHYGPADSSALLPNAGWLSSHVRPHQREVSTLSGGVMWQPLSGRLPAGLRLLPPPLPAALPGRLAAPFPVGLGTGGQRAYHVPRVEHDGGLRRASTPVVQRLRVPSSERHNLTTYLLVQAYQHLWLGLYDDACGASPGLTLPPDPGPRPP